MAAPMIDVFTNKMPVRYALIVNKEEAQSIRQFLERKGFWDRDRRLKHVSDDSVAIPINVDHMTWTEIGLPDKNPPCRIEAMEFLPSKTAKMEPPVKCMRRQVKALLAHMNGVNSPELLNDLPTSWEKHGDLILVSESTFQSKIWYELGDILWQTVCKCLGGSRLAKKSVVAPDGFRRPTVKLLYGQDGWVEHMDNGIRYCYDVTRCMFSIGNITEKLRVAQFDCRGETVVDLYAGIGYFTLPYLVHAGAERVIACEWNPAAVDALNRNVSLNNVQDRCTIYPGDNRQVCPANVADRVNLGLIPSSEQGWSVACAALKSNSGGTLHIHGNVTSNTHGNVTSNTHGNDSGADGHNVNMVPETNSCKAAIKSFNGVDSLVQTVECPPVSSQQNITLDSKMCDVSDKPPTFNPNVDHDQVSACEEQTVQQLNKSVEIDKVSRSSSDVMIHCNRRLKSEWRDWTVYVCDKIGDLLRSVHGREYSVKVLHLEQVKSYAPHVDHMVLDIECRPVPCNK